MKTHSSYTKLIFTEIFYQERLSESMTQVLILSLSRPNAA